jgi:hypothetical protein
MTYYPLILVDTGLLVAFYDSADQYHTQVLEFFASCTSILPASFSYFAGFSKLLRSNCSWTPSLPLTDCTGCSKIGVLGKFRVSL